MGYRREFTERKGDCGSSKKDFRHGIKFHWKVKGLHGFFMRFHSFLNKGNEGHRLGVKATIYLIQFSLTIIADVISAILYN